MKEISELETQIDLLQARVGLLEGRSVPIDFKDVTGESPTQVVKFDSTIEEIRNDPRVKKIVQIIILMLAVVWAVWVSLRGY